MVLNNLGERLSETFRKIARLPKIDKEELDAVLRDVQRALISADVDVELVAELCDRIRKKITSEKQIAGLTLKEILIKTLYDEIVSLLGSGRSPELKPQRILVVGLFGSGKTTTIGKIAKWFKTRGLKTGLVACDLYRPAAQTQLKQIGEKVGVPVYAEGKNSQDVAKNAIKKAKEDVLIFDSAGRDALDKELAKELKEMEKTIKPDETWLVLPAELGQAAKAQTEGFQKIVKITGIVITRMDGTAKGGGALSAAKITGANVIFLGTGEKIDDIESYEPKRFVSRLIGWGDIQGLLEKAKTAGIEEVSVLPERFTLNEFYEQLKNIQKMGPIEKIVEHIPGFGMMKIPKDMLNIQESKMKKWFFAIQSMTKEERENPEIIKGTRIARIAKGSGVPESDIKELLRYYKMLKKIIKQFSGKKLKRGMFGRFGKLWQNMNV
ncbi:MAG: signal recognition particle receptor subunit alpha [Candidatus Aenigmatarchaeota archaeon]